MSLSSYYSTISPQLKQAEITLSFSDLHGFLSGLICGGIQDQSWQPLLFQFTNDNHAYPTDLLNQIKKLYQHISAQLSDIEGFNFELGLVQNKNVFDYADSLSDWTNHFLLGIGLAQHQLDKEQNEIAEALNDLQEIAQLGYDENDDQEELEEALEEISEYVRTIATLFYTHFHRPTSTSTKKTLH
ncbi:YecA family protein [Rodentibacter caecimuris]|uniref:UPF0149 protein BKG89_04005 n=1 Tax=Rodentibacter caecimuris TaxID=1796644 RepID=A0ABX3KZ61_9PAST|nr:hypothetical protein BKG89_04005 [Rodentibacter heylii]